MSTTKFSLISTSSEKTIEIARKFTTLLKGNETLVLQGDLASGKTTFTKGIAIGLGINSPIKSPTFVISKEYIGKYKLNHVDLYRLENMGEDFFLEELINDGITVIEWPEQVPDLIPKDKILISFKYLDENKREIIFDLKDDLLKEFKCII